MLDTIIRKLAIILILAGGISCLIYFTPIGDLLNGEVEKKVKEVKKEVKEKVEKKKEEVKKEVEKVEKKVESNIEEVKDKVEDLKKLKLKDILK